MRKKGQKTSKYRGVCWNIKKQIWYTQIQHKGKRKFIGAFKKEKDARDAYLAKEKELYGRNFEPLKPVFDYEKGIVKIPLNCSRRSNNRNHYGKYWTIIDIDDYEKVIKHGWFISHFRYAMGHINNKCINLHTYLTGFKITDHINGNGLDNRRCNLRDVTTRQNLRNTCIRKNNKTGYKGVIFNAKTGFEVVIRLSSYKTAKEAAIAYDNAMRKLFKKYARYNFPKKGEESALINNTYRHGNDPRSNI